MAIGATEPKMTGTTLESRAARYDNIVRHGERTTARVSSIDLIRGAVMILMAAYLVLAPAGGSTDILRYRGFQTDSDGSFDFQNVPAGDYMLFATADTSVEYANPEVVRLFLTGAKAIHLEPHGTHSEKIPLSEASPEKKP